MNHDLLNVQLEYYDARLRLVSRKSRNQAQVSLRMIPKGKYCEIRITAGKNMDMFVSNSIVVVKEKSSENVLQIWIPNYKCSASVHGSSALLSHIQQFIDSVTNDDKENSPIKNNVLEKNSNIETTPEKGKRGFGIASRDLFRSGYTPETKIRNPCSGTGIGRNPGSNTKDTNSGHKLPLQSINNNTNKSTIRPNSTFMGLLTAAATGNSRHENLIPSPKKTISHELTDIQQQILTSCLEGRNVFYTGGAGTGKSTLLTTIIEQLTTIHGTKSIFVTATTGLAACAVGGITVHQFAGISSMLTETSSALEMKAQHDRVVAQVIYIYSIYIFYITRYILTYYYTSTYNLLLLLLQACSKHYILRRLRECQVLLVDEISMLSVTLLEVSRWIQ